LFNLQSHDELPRPFRKPKIVRRFQELTLRIPYLFPPLRLLRCLVPWDNIRVVSSGKVRNCWHDYSDPSQCNGMSLLAPEPT